MGKVGFITLCLPLLARWDCRWASISKSNEQTLAEIASSACDPVKLPSRSYGSEWLLSASGCSLQTSEPPRDDFRHLHVSLVQRLLFYPFVPAFVIAKKHTVLKLKTMLFLFLVLFLLTEKVFPEALKENAGNHSHSGKLNHILVEWGWLSDKKKKYNHAISFIIFSESVSYRRFH